MEASFCGCESGEFSGYHFTCAQLMRIGRDLCRAMIYCFDLHKTGISPSMPGPLDPKSKEDSLLHPAPDKKSL